ncbi:MAG: hypothetical protein N3A71_00215 [Candidatus Dojkabacteria bacterium]|nr:hypothetical protein [Candidatus Dojkabacteria bacterium]
MSLTPDTPVTKAPASITKLCNDNPKDDAPLKKDSGFSLLAINAHALKNNITPKLTTAFSKNGKIVGSFPDKYEETPNNSVVKIDGAISRPSR